MKEVVKELIDTVGEMAYTLGNIYPEIEDKMGHIINRLSKIEDKLSTVNDHSTEF